MQKWHIEERKETLIITDLEKGNFKVLANNPFNRVRYMAFNGEKINLKLDNCLGISETSEPDIFKLTYNEYEYITDISETDIIGKILSEALLNNNSDFAYTLLADFAEISISRIIQRDLIEYLMASYLNRLSFSEDFILIDGVFRVYYDACNNHQEVLTYIDKEGNKTFRHLCLVRINNNDFKPTYFNISGKYYVLGKHTCEVLSKVLFLLEASNHASDKVFWNQIKHLYDNEKLKYSVTDINL